MAYDDWNVALAPKVAGIKNIYHALQNHSTLDFLVAFSSVVAIHANPGQANYVAANNFLGSFVKSMRRKGFPASVIELGAVEDIGYVSRDEAILRACRQASATLLAERHVLQAVHDAILEAGSVTADEDYNMGRIITGLQPLDFNWMAKAATARDHRFAAFGQLGSSSANSQVPETDQVSGWIAAVDENPSILLEQSSTDFLIKEIGSLICTYLGEDTAELDVAAAGDITVDSLMTIEIHSWLRKRCRVEVPVVKLAKTKNVKKLTALVMQVLRDKYKLEQPAES
jgi:acyl carrier protein